MKNKFTETTSCPLCNEDGIHFSEEVVQIGGASIVVGVRKCQACSLVFTSPRLNADGLNMLYNNDYETSSESSQYCSRVHGSATEYAALTKLVCEFVPGGGTILDVGCGEGNLLAQLDNLNIYKLQGVEVSEPASIKARARGFKVHIGSINGEALRAENFDAVTMVYVLEHVPEPVDTLKAARRLLVKDGVLIVAVPNYNYLKLLYTGPINLILRGKATSLMAGEHLFNYTPRTFEALAHQAGFRVVKWKSATPHPVGGPFLRMAKRFAWLVSQVLFTLGVHIGGIHAVLKPDRSYTDH